MSSFCFGSVLHSFAQLSKDCLDDQARFEFFADETTRKCLYQGLGGGKTESQMIEVAV